MAYNFYGNYPQFPQYPQQPQQNNGIIWVTGIEGAKGYPVGAGNSVLLMDSENQYLYIKSADNTGMPSLRVFEYTELTESKEPEKIDMSEYVTKAELEEAISKVKPKKKKVIEVEEDE